MIEIKLPEKLYKILKGIDFTAYEQEILFLDEECKFRTNLREFFIYLNMYICAFGMDEKQEQCTEYGWQLYELYDYVMDEVSEEW